MPAGSTSQSKCLVPTNLGIQSQRQLRNWSQVAHRYTKDQVLIKMAMNPEREQMLKDNATKENEPVAPARIKCIRITGANVLALQDARSNEPKPSCPRDAKPSATATRKRAYDSIEQETLRDPAFDPRLELRRPPIFPPRTCLILQPFQNHLT
jgi:hypothetical protein